MRIPDLYPSSLNPPALSADDAAAAQEKLPWVLLERKAYVAKRNNATTAFSVTCNGKPIQATFCPRRPPLVSYVCLHSPDVAEIHYEPSILAAEEEFVLLSVTVWPEGFESMETTPASCATATTTRAFDLCLYDSKRGHWTTHDVSLNKPQMRRRRRGKKRFYHNNSTVVGGGDAGTMAFVDLWRGILFCDVLKVEDEAARRTKGEPMPLVRYVAVPEPLLQRNDDDDDDGNDDDELEGDAHRYRNIAVVGDRLKYVKLQPHRRPTNDIIYHSDGFVTDGYFIHGWMAATWSRPATCSSSSSDDNRWRQDTSIGDSSTSLKVPNSLNFKSLTRSGKSFESFDVRQPVLGLQDDADIVYFTTLSHIVHDDDNTWVAAVDTRKKELLGMTAFTLQDRIQGPGG
ncbi:LOW QUALITY PROTEIN: hypothetical protein SETIT_4G103700v2, partial [Setaria italica]